MPDIPAEAAPTDCNGGPHFYTHKKGPYSPVFVGQCTMCGAIDWPDLVEQVQRIREEERARIIATLQRAAEGRREYAKVLPEGHHGRETLETEAWAYESAVALIEDPMNLVGLIPLWMWTAEEEAFIRSREPETAGGRSDETAPARPSEAPQGDEPRLSRVPGSPERSQDLSGLRLTLARAVARRAGSRAFDHTDRAWDDLRNRWLSYADAALAALDGAGAVPEHTGDRP